MFRFLVVALVLTGCVTIPDHGFKAGDRVLSVYPRYTGTIEYVDGDKCMVNADEPLFEDDVLHITRVLTFCNKLNQLINENK